MNEKERIIKVMELEGLSPTQFADRIGVNRATVSHIVNGRYSPSLEVLQRTLNAIRTISADWLILGSGPIFRETLTPQASLFDIPPVVPEEATVEEESHNEPVKSIEKPKEEVVQQRIVKRISRILVFYDDNSFEEISN